MTNEIGLNRFGVANEGCKILRVPENDSIKGISFSYDDNGVNWISFATQLGDFKVSGD